VVEEETGTPSRASSSGATAVAAYQSEKDALPGTQAPSSHASTRATPAADLATRMSRPPDNLGISVRTILKWSPAKNPGCSVSSLRRSGGIGDAANQSALSNPPDRQVPALQDSGRGMLSEVTKTLPGTPLTSLGPSILITFGKSPFMGRNIHRNQPEVVHNKWRGYDWEWVRLRACRGLPA
jgi:hypothetical protein